MYEISIQLCHFFLQCLLSTLTICYLFVSAGRQGRRVQLNGITIKLFTCLYRCAAWVVLCCPLWWWKCSSLLWLLWFWSW